MSRHFASTDAQSYLRTLERRVGQLERRGRNVSAISSSLHAGRLGDALPDCVTMITPSDIPPPDPVGDVCDIWIDTSANPPIPRMWDGEDWIKITDEDLLEALRRVTHPIGIEGGEEMPPYDPNRTVGALWRDPKTGVLYYWDGNKWVRVTVGDVGHEEKLREDLEEARQEIADTGAELDEKLRQAQEDLDEARGRIDDAEDRLGLAEAELEAAAIWIAETGAELGVRLAQAEQDLSDAEDRLEGAETRLSNAEGEIAAASTWIDETGAQLDANLAQAQQDIDAAEVRLDDAETRLTTAEGEIADASDWIADTGAQLGTNLAAAQDALNIAFPSGPFDVDAAIDAIVAGAGGNIITYSNITEANKPGPPPTSTAGRKSGDIHRNRNQNTYEIYAEWMLGTSGTWQPVNFGDSILRSLDVGKITGGSAAFEQFVSQNLTSNTAVINDLWTNVVRSQKITTDMLIVGSGPNLVPDPGFQSTQANAFRTGYGPWRLGTYGAGPGGQPMTTNDNSGTGDLPLWTAPDEWWAVSSNAEIVFSALVRGPAGQLSAYLDVMKADGTQGTRTFRPLTWASDGGRAEARWNLPDLESWIGGRVAAVRVAVRRTSGSSSFYSFVSSPRVSVATDSSMIVDGAVTAKKITITGDENNPDEAGLVANIASIMNLDVKNLVSTNATIDEGVVNQLWADVVRSRKITTDMLIVGSGENRIVDPYFDSSELRDLRGAQSNVVGSWGRSTNNDRRYFGGDGQTGASQTFFFVTGEGGIGPNAPFTDVAEGDTFRARYTVDVTGNLRPYFRVKYADGTTAGSAFGAPWTTYTSGIRDVEYTFTIPAGVVGIIPALHFNLASTIRVYGGASLVRMSDASLIVDGAITAKKITITGDENDPDEVGLVANMASIMELDVGNLVALKGTIDDLVVNELWTKVVRSRKITTDMLIVGAGDNALSNPSFAENGNGWSTQSLVSFPSSGGMGGGGCLRLAASATQRGSYYGTRVGDRGLRPTVTPGETFRFTGWAWCGEKAIPAGGVRIFVRWYDATGETWISLENISNGASIPAGTWGKVEGQLTAPEGAVSVAVGLYAQASADGDVYWSNPAIVRASDSSLIVDGAITAKKITITGDPDNPDEVGLVANMAAILHLTAENLYVPGTATVEEGIINELWTQVVRSRKITTDMLLVGSGINLVVDPRFNDPTLNGYRLSQASGAWQYLDADASAPRRVRPPDSHPDTVAFRLYNSASDQYYEAIPDQVYRLRYRARTGGTAATRPAIRCVHQDGSVTYTVADQSAFTTLTGPWQWVEYTWTAPTTAERFAMDIQEQGGATGWSNYADPSVVVDGASLIVDGTILADHLDAASIRAAIGEFDLSIAGSYLLREGGRFATAASGHRVEMKDDAVASYDGLGFQKTRMDGYGFRAWAGTYPNQYESMTLDGLGVTFQTSASGTGISLRSDDTVAGRGRLAFSAPGFDPGFLLVDLDSGSVPELLIASPRNQGSSWFNTSNLRLKGNGIVELTADQFHAHTYRGLGRFIVEAGRFEVRMTGSSGGSEPGDLRLDSSGFYVGKAYSETTTAAANVNVSTNDGLIRRSTSLASAKVAVEPLTDWSGVKALEPVTYYDKGNCEALAAAIASNDEDALATVEHLTRWVGLTAEQAEQAGSGLATYDENGNLNGVAYERLAVALLPWLHELEDRITQLEGRTQ